MQYRVGKQRLAYAAQNSNLQLTFANGEPTTHAFGKAFKCLHLDKYTSGRLPAGSLKGVAVVEVDYFCKYVRDIANQSDIHAGTGRVRVGGIWVQCNKGRQDHPAERCLIHSS